MDDFDRYTFYGQIDNDETTRKVNALPVGLAPSAEVKIPIPGAGILTRENSAFDEISLVVKLPRMQDQLYVM